MLTWHKCHIISGVSEELGLPNEGSFCLIARALKFEEIAGTRARNIFLTLQEPLERSR
jgi:hypothetical protein